MNQPLISIIVPVYNVENYLNTCVQSLINQSYRNIEIILVDDGTLDNSGIMCDHYAQCDKRIKSIHKKNGGLSDARNYGVKIALGEYIGFVDSDDWISTNMYEKLLSNMLANDADISVCERVIVYENELVNTGETGNITVLSKEEALNVLYADQKYMSHVWNKLYKKELFSAISFPVGKNYEDIFIMHELFGKANKVVFDDEGLYFYRQRQGSIVNSYSRKNIEDFIDAISCRMLSKFTKGREKYVVQYYLSPLKMIEASSLRKNSEFRKLEKRVRKQILHNISFEMGMRCITKILVDMYFSPIKKIIKKIINSNCLYILNCVLSGGNKLRNSFGKRRIILLGSPEYNNLGDLAIAYTMKKYFETKFPDYVYCEYPEKHIKNNMYPMNIKQSDVLCLIGGGNFGDVYMDQQNIRKKVIKKYSNNIIIFPQTLFFTTEDSGKRELKEINNILCGKDNVSIFAREEISYEYLKNNITCSREYLAPDIVLYNTFETNKNKDGILLCLRQDAESSIKQEDREYILNRLYNVGCKIDFWDTCLNYHVQLIDRDKEVEQAINHVSLYNLLVTDRLHGVIFAAITGTPCICISNSNHKIKGIYNWVSSLGFIKMIDDIKNVDTIAIELLKKYPHGSNSRIDKAMFKPLDDVVHSILKGDK